MSLINDITDKIGTYECLDDGWMQFIDDHRSHLLSSAIVHYPTLAYFRPYEYNLEYYLRSIGFDLSATWIVRLINEIVTNQDFVSITSIAIPDLTEVKKLFELYRTIKAKLA